MAHLITKVPSGIHPNLVVDEHFKTLLPVHTKDEQAAFALNINEDGVIRDPVVAWKKSDSEWIIVDGYNRYATGKPVEVWLWHFSDRSDAERWVVMNQCGRRNLSPYDRAALVAEHIGTLSPDELAKAAQCSLTTARKVLRDNLISNASAENLNRPVIVDPDRAEEELDNYIGNMKEKREEFKERRKKGEESNEKRKREKRKSKPKNENSKKAISNKKKLAALFPMPPSKHDCTALEKEKENIEFLNSALSSITEIRKCIKACASSNTHVSKAISDRMISDRVSELRAHIEACVPYATCPACLGTRIDEDDDPCRVCDASGWVNKAFYDRNKEKIKEMAVDLPPVPAS